MIFRSWNLEVTVKSCQQVDSTMARPGIPKHKNQKKTKPKPKPKPKIAKMSTRSTSKPKKLRQTRLSFEPSQTSPEPLKPPRGGGRMEKLPSGTTSPSAAIDQSPDINWRGVHYDASPDPLDNLGTF
jgi:hypothetical protein